MSENIETHEFIHKIIIPNKILDIESDNIWALKGIDHKFWVTSNKYANLFGHTSYHGLVGKNLLQLDVLYKKNIEIIHRQEKEVLSRKRSSRGILFFDLTDTVHIFATTIDPILFNNEIIGFDKKFTPISKHNFDLHKIGLVNQDKNISLNAKTRQEYCLIYLLILNKNQQEIAKYLGVSRSRVVQIITKLSGNLGITGCATKLLIDQAITEGYHKKIPVELFVLMT